MKKCCEKYIGQKNALASQMFWDQIALVRVRSNALVRICILTPEKMLACLHK